LFVANDLLRRDRKRAIDVEAAPINASINRL
jgi:hypothetical protein